MNPTKVFLGDSFKIKFKPPVFEADVQYILTVSSHGQSVNFPLESADQGELVYSISSAGSLALPPGQHVWSIVAQRMGMDERQTLVSGVPLQVLADPTQPLHESYARRMLNALQALLEGRVMATDAVYSAMTYEGRSITKLSPAELMRAIALFRAQVEQEELNAKNGKGPRVIKAWFRAQR